MADRYLSEFEDDEPDAQHSARENRPGAGKRKRRIRIVENGMPDKPTSGFPAPRPVRAVEYTEYATDSDRDPPAFPQRHGVDDEIENRRLAEGRVRERDAYPQPSLPATPYDRPYQRRPSISMGGRPRLPQLPIRGGLSDLVGRGRLAMALLMALLAFVGYTVSRRSVTTTQGPSTAVPREISLLAEHDIALGQKSVPQMLARYGDVSTDDRKRNIVQQIGARLVQSNGANCDAYQFRFDVLADEKNIAAFALPGGRVYVTAALLDQLTSHGEIAGVLAHEMAHVTQRHGVSRLANATLASGNSGAVVMASFLDPVQFQPTSQDVNALIAETVQLRYETAEVQNSDSWAVYYMTQAGFNPASLVTALQRVTQWDGRPTDFALRHQPPENQLTLIQQQIQERFPQGVPTDFIP